MTSGNKRLVELFTGAGNFDKIRLWLPNWPFGTEVLHSGMGLNNFSELKLLKRLFLTKWGHFSITVASHSQILYKLLIFYVLQEFYLIELLLLSGSCLQFDAMEIWNLQSQPNWKKILHFWFTILRASLFQQTYQIKVHLLV